MLRRRGWRDEISVTVAAAAAEVSVTSSGWTENSKQTNKQKNLQSIFTFAPGLLVTAGPANQGQQRERRARVAVQPFKNTTINISVKCYEYCN